MPKRTPEQTARAVERNRLRRQKMKELLGTTYKERKFTPQQLEVKRAKQREYMRKRRGQGCQELKDREQQHRITYREKLKVWRRSTKRLPPADNAYERAAPSPARDLLFEIRAMVPRLDCRDDIIAEAALLVLEGKPVAQAVQDAKQRVLRQESRGRYAVPLDECYWL